MVKTSSIGIGRGGASSLVEGCGVNGIAPETGRQLAIVGPCTVLYGKAELLEVILTLHAVSSFTDFLHRWQEQTNQDGNDGDDHQQLDQCKSTAPQGNS